MSRVAVGLALGIAALPMTAAGSGQFNGLLNMLKQSTQHADHSHPGSKVPASEIAASLKEALAKGTTDAINSLGRNGGFWNNPKVHIPLPGRLEQAGQLSTERRWTRSS